MTRRIVSALAFALALGLVYVITSYLPTDTEPAAAPRASGAPEPCEDYDDTCFSISRDINCTSLDYGFKIDNAEILHWTDAEIAKEPPSERQMRRDEREARTIHNARRTARMQELNCR